MHNAMHKALMLNAQRTLHNAQRTCQPRDAQCTNATVPCTNALLQCTNAQGINASTMPFQTRRALRAHGARHYALHDAC